MAIELINGETWMDTEDVCAITGHAVNTFEGGRSRGADLPPHYKFRRRVRYKLSDVEAWIEARRVVPAAAQLRAAAA